MNSVDEVNALLGSFDAHKRITILVDNIQLTGFVEGIQLKSGSVHMSVWVPFAVYEQNEKSQVGRKPIKVRISKRKK